MHLLLVYGILLLNSSVLSMAARGARRAKHVGTRVVDGKDAAYADSDSGSGEGDNDYLDDEAEEAEAEEYDAAESSPARVRR